MIASAYIKDKNIHLYNEGNRYSKHGGLAYELGRPFLDFICYEPERFDDAFSIMASAFEDEYAYMIARADDAIEKLELQKMMTNTQEKEIYIFFYYQALYDFIFTFARSPKDAIKQISEKIPGSEERLKWAWDFEWPTPPKGKVYKDTEKRLYRATQDVVAAMLDDLKLAQTAMATEIELLIHLRDNVPLTTDSSMEYLYMLELIHEEQTGSFIYLEQPFKTFYGVVQEPEIAEFYQIEGIRDLLRYEFIKMIEHDVFIKKCKNCGHFFIPRLRSDAEYCNRPIDETGKRCNEVGAMIQYEKRVAQSPILEMHKKAYRRFNSRTRTGKMSQAEFLAWSEEASRKRDECVAGVLPVDEFQAWLEQGRVRKPRKTI